MQLHLVAEQNTTVTFASFGIVSSILEEGSKVSFGLKKLQGCLFFVGHIYFKSVSPKI
jgi:hypothetical protein